MAKKKNDLLDIRQGALLVAFIILLTTFALIGLPGPKDTIVLDSVEVREYEGKDLSSINDFRENSIKGPQHVDKGDYSLDISGFVEEEKSYSYDELISDFQSYEKVVALYCVEGWDVTILWEGLLLEEILRDAGVKETANTVIFHAYDGYSSSLPLSYILENDIILAHSMNSVELPPERGFPFQLVAEDKWSYKWVKWITKIEISNDPSYEGYWESRGYSNSGDLDKHFF